MKSDESEDPKGRGAQGKVGEIVVFMIRRESKCAECGEELFPGSLLRMEGEKALCMDCADLGHLEFLPSGDTALTRRTTKYTSLRAVVVRWARARKRYERQGILAENEAIARAEAECEGDSELRKVRRAAATVKRAEEDKEFIARFYAEIRRLYPRCPEAEARSIAQHACQKYSGRVGRSAAAKELAEPRPATVQGAHRTTAARGA